MSTVDVKDPSAEPERILIVDDEPMICEVLELVLQAQGWQTVAAHTLEDARRVASEGPIAAALLDKNLPDGNGVDLLAELRERLPDTAFLIMTGYSSFPSAVHAMRMGASDYLVKPFSTMDEVALRVRKAVDDVRARRERLTLASELDRARSELAAVFEAADEPILVFDLEGRIRRLNGAARRLYEGVAPGLGLSELGDPEGSAAILLALSGQVVRRERVTRRSPTGPITLMATLAPITGPGGAIVALVETAISIEETLRAQRALHQADKMSTLGALAATLAHELANPLGCAVANLSVLGEPDEEGRIQGVEPSEVAVVLSEIRDSLALCRDIIKRTRDFASPQSPQRAVPVPLAQVVSETARFVRPQLGRGVELSFDVPGDLEVLGDRTGLVQVLVNLVVNAGHAVRGRESPRIVVSGCVEGERALLTVADNGVGIPASEIPRIFERFFTTKPVGVGTGLGLAVCRDIVASHGGTIEVHSKAGEGTRFEIRMPVWRAEERSRILIVDDDPYVLTATARALKSHFDVATAGSADEAIELLSASAGIDMVLSDYHMPGRSGADLLAEVSQRWPRTKRLIMTGNLDPRARAAIDAKAQPVDILLKPLESVLLRTRLLSVLAA